MWVVAENVVQPELLEKKILKYIIADDTWQEVKVDFKVSTTEYNS